MDDLIKFLLVIGPCDILVDLVDADSQPATSPVNAQANMHHFTCVSSAAGCCFTKRTNEQLADELSPPKTKHCMAVHNSAAEAAAGPEGCEPRSAQ
jgi:hypothetical protein